MNRQKELYRPEDLEKMDSLQLDDVLRAELEKECSNTDTVLGIIEILEGREKDMPFPEHPKVTEAKNCYDAWDEGARFAQANQPKWILRFAKVAAIITIVLTTSLAIPQALCAENLFDLIGKWTTAFFSFGEPERTAKEDIVAAQYVFSTDNPGLQQVYDVTARLGITQHIVPQWLPDGYALTKIHVTTSQKRVKITSCFANGSQEIIICIREILDPTKLSYFKNDADVELYEYGGVQHYIVKNENAKNIIWYTDNVECQLNVGDKDVYAIIKSVYNGE